MEPSSAVGQLKRSGQSDTTLLARLRRLTRRQSGRKLSAFSACKAVINGNHPSLEVRAFFEGLPADDKHYWIATYYALLMPQKKGRKLAAYFTPPQFAKYAIRPAHG